MKIIQSKVQSLADKMNSFEKSLGSLQKAMKSLGDQIKEVLARESTNLIWIKTGFNDISEQITKARKIHTNK